MTGDKTLGTRLVFEWVVATDLYITGLLAPIGLSHEKCGPHYSTERNLSSHYSTERNGTDTFFAGENITAGNSNP